jgi:integrase
LRAVYQSGITDGITNDWSVVMAKAQGLWRKTDTSPWYHHRRVEADAMERLRGLFRSGVIYMALGTRDEVEAERRNAYATAFTTEIFDRAIAGQALPTANEIAEFAHAIQKTGRPPVRAPMAWPIQAYEAEPLASRWYFEVGQRLPVGISDQAVETSVSRWLQATFGTGPSEDGIFRTWSPDLPSLIAESAVDFLDGRDRSGATTVADLTMLLGDLEEKPEDWWKSGDLPALQDALMMALERVAARTSGHLTRRRASPEEFATPRLSMLFAGWKNRRVDPPAAKSVAEAERALTLWNAITGDPPLGTVDRAQVAEFVETLHALPDSRWRAFSGLSAKEAVAAADREDPHRLRRLSAASVVKFIGLLRSMAEQAVGLGGIGANPFTKAAPKSPGSSRRKSLPFSPDEMRTYLTSPLFTGCAKLRPLSSRAEAGNILEQDDLYWMALIAPYTGCRREEIGQLALSDFGILDGIHFVRVDDEEDQHLKNEASRRIIPIHPVLLRAGLIDRVEHRRQMGKTHLFDLKPNRLAQRTGSIGSDLNDYLANIGIKGERKSFRSFRSTAVSRLSKIDPDLRRALFGHEAGERGDVHAEHYLTFPVAERLEAIRRIDYGVDPSEFVRKKAAQ